MATILWQFSILPAPAAHAVSATPTEEDEIYQKLPPLDPDCRLECNCFRCSTADLCLCEFTAHQDTASNDDQSDSFANLQLNDEKERVEDEVKTGNTVSNNNIVLCSEYFKIKGSMWEDRYQKSFQKLSEARAAKQEVSFCITAEPNNIQDKNAHMFEFWDEQICTWRTLGYCGVEKIPKLTKAILRKEIVHIKVENIRRRWIPKVLSFKFEGGLNIVKKGAWEKNQPNNRYNSDLHLV